MRERLIGVRHPMRVFTPLDRDAAITGGIEQFARQPLFHRILRARPGARDQPADRQRLAAFRPHLDRYLIGGAADAPRANLDRRADITERIMKHADRVLAATPLNTVERAIDNPLGGGLLALVHQAIHELGHDNVAEFRIRLDFAFDRSAAAGHRFASLSRPLGAVFRTALAAVFDALGVVGAADDVIAHARQILDAAAADQHDRMFLQIVALAGDVAGDLEPVGETDARDLAQSRVRLFWRDRIDARADAALLRALLHRWNLVPHRDRLPWITDQLVDRRHSQTSQNVNTARRKTPRRGG